MRKISVWLTCLFCFCMLIPFHMAATAIELTGENSITLNYYVQNEDLPLADAPFQIFLAAVPDGEGGYALTDQFSAYRVDLSDLDWNEAGRLTELAVTLSAYASRDKLKPLQNGVTDENGILTFDGLADGLYLVQGSVLAVQIGKEEWNFSPQPLLLPMPYPNADGSSDTEMEVDVKYDRYPPESKGELVGLSVVKVWKSFDQHPVSVTAQLLCDGVLVDSVELNAENDWRYVWDELNAGHVWQITEGDVPEDCTVSIHREEYAFTITNTGTGGSTVTDDGTTTTTTVTTTTTSTSTSQVTTTTATATSTTGSSGVQTTNTTIKSTVTDIPKLPQTGQLWWPVPIFLSAGVLLFGSGLILRSDSK